jgi:hypothetical protein
MQRPTSVKRHLPSSCSVPEESARPTRSRTDPDRIRGRVSPLGTLCDGDI